MQRNPLGAWGWAGLAVLLIGPWLDRPARGGPIQEIISFGDSLSDVGNVYKETGGVAPPSSLYSAAMPGVFTNGPNWVQQLAADLGIAAPTASLGGGTDYAYGGAMTGTGSIQAPITYDIAGDILLVKVPNTEQQVSDYLAGNHPGPGQLFTIWAGANDLLHTPNPDATTAITAAGNVASAAETLAQAGAGPILVANLPLLGNLPYIVANEPTAVQQGLDQLSVLFNQTLQSDLAALPGSVQSGIHLIDVYSLYNDVVANPARYGLTNVDGIGLAASLSGQDAQGYLSWDGIHPTTHADQLIAALGAQAVPEPSSMTLLAAAMATMAGWGWSRRRKSRAARG